MELGRQPRRGARRGGERALPYTLPVYRLLNTRAMRDRGRQPFAADSRVLTLDCVQVIPETASIESKGKEITRKGTEDNPAVTVENDKPGGNPVIKKASELHVFKEVHMTANLLGPAV